MEKLAPSTAEVAWSVVAALFGLGCERILLPVSGRALHLFYGTGFECCSKTGMPNFDACSP
jgi:hypothetical protein